MDNFTIEERLSYLKVCDEATKYYEEQSRLYANQDIMLSSDYKKQVKKFDTIKSHIIEDLTRDPRFLEYTANILESKEEYTAESSLDPNIIR